MKLVELLAKELSEWPEDWVSAAQDGNSKIAGFTTSKLFFKDDNDRCAEPTHGYYIGLSRMALGYQELSSDYATAVVTKAQWQAERDRQKGGEWKRHRGGKQPVFGGKVEVKFRDGDVEEWFTDSLFWGRSGKGRDIMQFRVISQPQAEEVKLSKAEVRAQFMPEPEFVYLEAKTDQIDGPILWRDTVSELDAYIEEFTREREALIQRLADEGFVLIKPITDVRATDLSVDMSDWRNWKRGDVVEVIIPNNGKLPIGKQYTVCEIEAPEYQGGMMVKVFDDEGESHWPEDDTYEGRMVFKFIRRP